MKQNLWIDFKNGDAVAFGNIYSLHIDELYAYGTKLCADVPLVKDSVQDVFIDLFEHRNRLSEPRNIKYYLFKILKRTIFKKLKKNQKNVDLFHSNNVKFSTGYTFENKLLDKELDDNRKRLIARLLDGLTAKQQEILYLRFTMGFNYLEIARILEIDHNSVRKQVYRAIKSLRESTTFRNHINIVLFLQAVC